MSQTPADWYPDPHDPSSLRYWDGQQWTDHRSPAHAQAEPAPTQAIADPQQTPAGWFPDPHDATSTRYWDGQQWTENRAPAYGQAQRAPGEKEQNATGIIIAGYIFAVLIPLVGFIIGLTQINRNRHGLWVVLVSVLAFLIFLGILSSQESTALVHAPHA